MDMVSLRLRHLGFFSWCRRESPPRPPPLSVVGRPPLYPSSCCVTTDTGRMAAQSARDPAASSGVCVQTEQPKRCFPLSAAGNTVTSNIPPSFGGFGMRGFPPTTRICRFIPWIDREICRTECLAHIGGFFIFPPPFYCLHFCARLPDAGFLHRPGPEPCATRHRPVPWQPQRCPSGFLFCFMVLFLCLLASTVFSFLRRQCR